MPKKYIYYNNYETETSILLTAGGTTLTVDSTGDLVSPTATSFDVLLLTISHPTDPAIYEIVSVTAVTPTTQMTIVRAQEGTTALEWPIDSVVSARVTGAMYSAYAGGLADGEVVIKGSNVDVSKTPSDVTFINSERYPAVDYQRHIGGYDYIAPFELWGGAAADAGRAARNTVQPVTIYSDPVNLGNSPTWQASTSYAYGRVVFPTVDNNFAYIATAFGPYYKSGTSGDTEPTWPTTELATVVDNGVTWVAMPDTVVQMNIPFGMIFYPESVGFICKWQSGAVQPTILFSGDGDVGGWVDSVQTTNLTDSYMMQKYDVELGAQASTILDARIEVRGTGEYLGWYFWTGFLVEW